MKFFKNQVLKKASAFSKPQLIIFALTFAAIGGYIIFRSFAAGPPTDFFIAPNGSDANPCSQSAPCLTFDAANDVAGNDANVEVGCAAGQTTANYPTQVLTGSNGRTATAFFKAASGCAVWITSAGAPYGLVLGPQCCTGTPSHLSFDGINIRNGGFACTPDSPQPTDITYKNAHIVLTVSRGGPLFSFGACDHVTLGPSVELGPACCNSDGIQAGISGGVRPSNLLVDDVYIHDFYDSCQNMPTAVKQQWGCDGLGFSDYGGGGHTPLTATLNGAVDSSQTTITVASAANWPSQANSGFNGNGHFIVQIGSEFLHVTSTNGGSTTWNVIRADGNLGGGNGCGTSPAAATHPDGATVTLCNNGFDHIDGFQAIGCNTCTIQNSHFYSGNPTSPTTTGAAQGIFFGGGINGATYSNLTFVNNMLECWCGSVLFSIGTSPDNPGTNLTGYAKFLYNTVAGGGISVDDFPQNRPAPGTQIIYAGNILTGGIHSYYSTSCTFTDSAGGTITPVFRNNLVAQDWVAACDPSNVLGTATFISENFFTPDLHLVTASAGIDAGESTYCPTTDIDGDTRPQGSACDIGADEYTVSPPPPPTPPPSGSPAPPVTYKPGDLNHDGYVNVFDLSILLTNYSTTNYTADIDKNGSVNVIDLSILLSNYGK